MKKYVIALFFLGLFGYSSAQDLSFGFDLVNRYVWRGLDLGGKSPNIQPWASIAFGNDTHNLTVGAWGAFSFAGTANEETDLFVSYKFKNMVSLSITDYFFPGLYTGSKADYFEWGADSTGHLLEGTFSFTGTEKIPFTALFAMNFYGSDARKANGDLFLSKYAEIGFNGQLKETKFNVFVGAALDDPDTDAGETGFYLNEKPGITNVGIKFSKTMDITDKFSVPVNCALITNPSLQKIYLTLGLSF
jgi:hypothetical protein